MSHFSYLGRWKCSIAKSNTNHGYNTGTGKKRKTKTIQIIHCHILCAFFSAIIFKSHLIFTSIFIFPFRFSLLLFPIHRTTTSSIIILFFFFRSHRNSAEIFNSKSQMFNVFMTAGNIKPPSTWNTVDLVNYEIEMQLFANIGLYCFGADETNKQTRLPPCRLVCCHCCCHRGRHYHCCCCCCT